MHSVHVRGLKMSFRQRIDTQYIIMPLRVVSSLRQSVLCCATRAEAAGDP